LGEKRVLPLTPYVSSNMIKLIMEDIQACFERDPAARNIFEVVLTYAGLHATLLYRFAHMIWKWNIPVVPRLISQIARFLTGIEIHPAAIIGRSFFIDHGMGVVIGETTEIGDHVTLYQGVTLGGTGKEAGKRHPSIGNHVIIGTGAKVLGNLRIGDYVRIGANSVVLRSVPDHATVVGIPGKILDRPLEEEELDHTRLPDPITERLEKLENEMAQCKEALKKMKAASIEAAEKQLEHTK